MRPKNPVAVSRLNSLAQFLVDSWAPIGLASDSRGNSLPLRHPDAERYSIGGAIQVIFDGAVAPLVAAHLSITLDALEDRAVLGWESDAGRNLFDILRLIEITKLALEAGLLPDLSRKDSNDSYLRTFFSARTRLIRLVSSMDMALDRVAA